MTQTHSNFLKNTYCQAVKYAVCPISAIKISKRKVLFFLCLFVFMSGQLKAQNKSWPVGIDSYDFKNPPLENHIYTWWHFIDGYIIKEGITKDLEAMKQQGISGATMLNVNSFNGKLNNPTVKFGSVEWYDMFKYALQEAKRLNMEIGMSNCDGWSESGGPWITPENSMKQYIWRKSFVTGGNDIQIKLDKPIGNNDFYQDASIVAYRSSKPNSFKLAAPSITIEGKKDAQSLVDGSPISNINLKVGEPVLVQFKSDFTAEILLVQTEIIKYKIKQPTVFEIEASEDGIHFNKVGKVTDSIVNETILLPFPRTTAKIFRISIKEILNNEGIKEMSIGEIALLQKGEKGLYQPSIIAHQSKTVAVQADNMDDFYISEKVSDKKDIIKSTSEVIDLTSKMHPDGTLEWKAPSGDWTIIRFGYTTTGRTNHPASKEGIGLECDKMDTTALNIHFKNFPQKLIEVAGALKGNTFTYFLVDSWEALFQNWTANFEQEFEKRRGYSMIPYIPILCGEMVESSERSEAYLHDFRHTIADLIEINYFKHLADLCHRQGMKLHAEGIYGGVIYPPLDILKSYSYFDVPMTEFWARFNAVDTPFVFIPKNKLNHSLVTHAAFLYNKPVVASESYTGLALYSDSPWDLKLYGDNAFTQGVNRIVLHSYVHQPTERKPGLTLGMYGLTFNRHNTWWPYAFSYFDEQARVQYILQKGKTVFDVLVYLGDKMPFKEYDNKNGLLLPGMKFNYINADVLYNRISVKDRKLMLDNDFPFQFLVIQDQMMDLETLQKIESLVKQGAIVIGPKPLKTLSLKNYDSNNAALQSIASALWANVDGSPVVENTYGKGMVIWGKPLDRMLKEEKFIPDLQVKGAKIQDLMYIHKKMNDDEVYYVVNNDNNMSVQIEASFRVTGKIPELWDPVDGQTYQQALFSEHSGTMVIPLFLRPKQSIFVVFKKGVERSHFTKLNGPDGSQIFPATSTIIPILPSVYFDIDNQVKITSETGGLYNLISDKGKSFKFTLQDAKKIIYTETKGTVTLENEPEIAPFNLKNFTSLTNSENSLVKYYSGVASYQMEISIPADFVKKENNVYLQLDQFGSTASIELNGKQVSTIWEPSYKLDITAFVKTGNNTLLIKVANPWRNRPIGDMVSSRGDKNAWTTSPFRENAVNVVVDKNSILLNSGLSKPIKIYSINTLKVKL